MRNIVQQCHNELSYACLYKFWRACKANRGEVHPGLQRREARKVLCLESLWCFQEAGRLSQALLKIRQISLVQVSHSSRVRLVVTPWTAGFPVHHQLPELTQTHVHWVSDAIQPSHPLSSPSRPAFNLSQHPGLLKWVGSLHQVAKVLEFQLQHQSFQWIFRTDFH